VKCASNWMLDNPMKSMKALVAFSSAAHQPKP